MRVRWTPDAELDRSDVMDHIATDNPHAASRMDQLFEDATARLADFPLLGHPGMVPGTRELVPHEHYRLVYEVDPGEATVWILALTHTARQWPPVDR
ncbi:type II toxin-antitoxin system RelE/ParE family toxin [Marilutibacter alkalisoli]|uniref:Type II toxin-antitoxin system RelE/ParE family toxin n=1 Tax=Marilutibacter alkalisoli TaxID=2591633 RepID=A0A514BU89_9GAMM|nr:type II toxin-antitoxin system RelE/ParE family toxin [Lysobacter alkalisoli]QDH70936.1 type II toxin-antitoxin system RelE/ParE family toxin [Lysobacter alkalisoli]